VLSTKVLLYYCSEATVLKHVFSWDNSWILASLKALVDPCFIKGFSFSKKIKDKSEAIPVIMGYSIAAKLCFLWSSSLQSMRKTIGKERFMWSELTSCLLSFRKINSFYNWVAWICS